MDKSRIPGCFDWMCQNSRGFLRMGTGENAKRDRAKRRWGHRQMQMGTYTFAKSVRPHLYCPQHFADRRRDHKLRPYFSCRGAFVDDYQMTATEVIDEAGRRIDCQ